MREIKFRALLRKKDKGSFWVYYNTLTGASALFDDGSWDVIVVKDLQFTGLLDKNGKDIYEGDVVVQKTLVERNGEKFVKIWQSTVEWVGGGFNIQHRINLEVIGNIYENPRLVK